MGLELILRGTDGLSKGAEFSIPEGSVALIGRSHSCDICLSDLEAYKSLRPEDEVARIKFRTVAGKHLKIFFKSPKEVILENISKSGTYLQGKRLEGSISLDLRKEKYILLLGLEERFVLFLREAKPKQNDKSNNQSEKGEEK